MIFSCRLSLSVSLSPTASMVLYSVKSAAMSVEDQSSITGWVMPLTYKWLFSGYPARHLVLWGLALGLLGDNKDWDGLTSCYCF